MTGRRDARTIVAVSPNTSTDRISVVEGFTVGGTLRTVTSFDQAGGSGSHAASVVIELGGDALAIGAIGGGNGLRWRRAAARQHLPNAVVEIDAENRSSFVLIDRHLGKIAEIIDPGPELDAREVDLLFDLVRDQVEDAGLLVVSGSLPPGVPVDFHARCIEAARAAGCQTLVDSHSEPMRRALAARPWMIKPNLDEMHQLMGVRHSSMRERVDMARRLVQDTVDVVLLSMEAEGAILATRDGTWHVVPPAAAVTLPGSEGINPVGCGDALVGAFAHRWVTSGDLIESARWGVAAAHVNLGRYEVPSSPLEDVRGVLPLVRVHAVEVSDATRP